MKKVPTQTTNLIQQSSPVSSLTDRSQQFKQQGTWKQKFVKLVLISCGTTLVCFLFYLLIKKIFV